MPDSTVAALTENTALVGTDLMVVVDDPGGTPLMQKTLVRTVQKFMSAKGSDVASAGTTTLGDGEFFHITGTTTITDIDFTDSWDGRRAWLVFDGALTLTHNATTLILPTGANITTAAGDCALVQVESGDNVRVLAYLRASGAALAATAASDTAAGEIEIAIQSEMEAGSDTTRAVTPGRQHFHPSAAKFWVYWTANSTTILSSYNMTSIADTAVGDADGTIATDFSDANWAGFVQTNDASTNGWDADSIQSSGFNARAAGTFGVLCGFIIDGGTAVAALVDPQQWQVVGFGDHA